MKKFLFVFIAMAFVAGSCVNNSQKSEAADSNTEVVVDEITALNLSDFDSLAGDFVGKKIQLTGTVDHVCTHGGQRMFLVNQESNVRIKVTPDEHVAAFNTNLVGSSVVIEGIVEEMRIDASYIIEWEEEIKAGAPIADDKGEGTHLGGNMEKGGEGADISEEMEKVNNLRSMLEESGSDHLSFYSVLVTKLDVLEPAEADTEADLNE